ncbi:MAG: hypothetical protein HYS74_01075 [Parcubacteria group bacterium]|nr:hypothetical protein [Parcubacteria group bacterium]
MSKLLHIFFALMIAMGLSSTSSFATEHDGNPSLCENPWESEGSTSSATEIGRSRRIISECKVVNPQTLDISSNPALADFLGEIKKDLWDTERLPKDVLYRYTLTIINDWDKNVSVNLSRWEVVHSPYTLVAKGFVVDIPACSYARIQFLSPWAPELYASPVNIGMTTKDGEWSAIGDGIASILTPVWYQYFSEGMNVDRLPPDETKTKACSSK